MQYLQILLAVFNNIVKVFYRVLVINPMNGISIERICIWVYLGYEACMLAVTMKTQNAVANLEVHIGTLSQGLAVIKKNGTVFLSDNPRTFSIREAFIKPLNPIRSKTLIKIYYHPKTKLVPITYSNQITMINPSRRSHINTIAGYGWKSIEMWGC